MKKVIVIGANGFLGYKLTEYLHAQGVSVVAFVPDGFDANHVKDLGIPIVGFTFDNLMELQSVSKGVDTIYNMAWVGVNAKERNNEDVQLTNLAYNVKVVQYAEACGIKRLVVPGSAAQYACGQAIIDGLHLPSPSDLYSAAKVATYDFCKVLCDKRGIELIWPLITSIYGPGRDDNNLISYAIKTLLAGNKPSFTGLEQKWDYLYIDDLIVALYLLGEKGIGGKLYPVGSGIHRQMREYVEIIRDIINPSLPLGIGDYPYKNPVIDHQIMDISELKKDTGFIATTSFEDGISKTIEYFRQL